MEGLQAEHLVYDLVANFDMEPWFPEKIKMMPEIEVDPINVMPIHSPTNTRKRAQQETLTMRAEIDLVRSALIAEVNREEEKHPNSLKFRTPREIEFTYLQQMVKQESLSTFYSPLTKLWILNQPVQPYLVGDIGPYSLPFMSDKIVKSVGDLRVTKIEKYNMTHDILEFETKAGEQVRVKMRGGKPQCRTVYVENNNVYHEDKEGAIRCSHTFMTYVGAPTNATGSLVASAVTLSLIDYVRMVQLKHDFEYPFMYSLKYYIFPLGSEVVHNDQKGCQIEVAKFPD